MVEGHRFRRRSIRLKGYDYRSVGAYFVTIGTYRKQKLFGAIVCGRVELNDLGRIAREEWFRVAELREYVVLQPDEFVVMEDHVHGLIWIIDRTSTQEFGGEKGPRVAAGSLGAIVRGYKSAVTREINRIRNSPGEPVWQRNYYERVLRHQEALDEVRRYILQNPVE